MESGVDDSSPSPPLPLYVLRGHSAQINTVHFLRSNSRLLTGDADGWVIMWKISSRRPVAVWRPHENAILGMKDWGENRVITHGRDNKLYVWKLGSADESGLSTAMPVEASTSSGTQSHRAPWLLHSIDTNALNFCSFAMCYQHQNASEPEDTSPASTGDERAILIALPSAMDSDLIDILQLPSGKRIYSSIGMDKTTPTVVSSASQTKSGMAMSVSLFYHSSESSNLMLAVGYESGHVCVFGKDTGSADHTSSAWQSLYVHKTHAQPVLSISVLDSHTSPSATSKYIFSSAADSLIAKHPIPPPAMDDDEPRSVALPTQPRIVTTHHTGQQSLVIRSDGKILATSGWDGKIRIYSTKSLAELAVLKWHKDGCYAVNFGYVSAPPTAQKAADSDGSVNGTRSMQIHEGSGAVTGVTVGAAREQRERERHWVAAGGKDGKVTLWEVY